MSRRVHLTDDNVRAMLRLMGQLGELPRDRATRVSHLLHALCQLTNARAGTVTIAWHDQTPNEDRKVTVIDGHMLGIETDGLAAIAEYLRTLEPKDPLSKPLYDTEGPLVVRQREQLLDTRGWHTSAHFNEVRRKFGVDDCIAAKVELQRRPRKKVQTVCVHRHLRDGRFSPRHAKMIELLLAEVKTLIAPEIDDAKDELPPRLRQTLDRLLAGDSAKQLARRLGISVHTANDYIKALYRRCGVSGRGELFARYAR